MASCKNTTSANPLAHADNVELKRLHQFGNLRSALAANMMMQHNVKPGLKNVGAQKQNCSVEGLR